jgi:hypothetical protein
MAWPPKVGQVLPRAENAFGVREKLADYSLNRDHKDGGPKARGFELILGITISDLEHLAQAIEVEKKCTNYRREDGLGDRPIRRPAAPCERIPKTLDLVEIAESRLRLITKYSR